MILALRGTFEALIGSLPKETSSLPLTMPYPFQAAVAQIDTILDMATMLLRIERICQSRIRIKKTLESTDTTKEEEEE